jgi:hypothetical protein
VGYFWNNRPCTKPEDRNLLRVLYHRQPDKQCTYNVLLKSFRATIVVVEVQVRVLNNPNVCICSLIYPTCNAHAPYCHLWSVPLYNIFSHYFINSKIFEKNLQNTKCVFWLSLQLLSKTFLILRRKEWDDKKCMWVFMYSNLYSCPILMKLEFYQKISENSSNIKFHENPTRGVLVSP